MRYSTAITLLAFFAITPAYADPKLGSLSTLEELETRAPEDCQHGRSHCKTGREDSAEPSQDLEWRAPPQEEAGVSAPETLQKSNHEKAQPHRRRRIGTSERRAAYKDQPARKEEFVAVSKKDAHKDHPAEYEPFVAVSKRGAHKDHPADYEPFVAVS